MVKDRLAELQSTEGSGSATGDGGNAALRITTSRELEAPIPTEVAKALGEATRIRQTLNEVRQLMRQLQGGQTSILVSANPSAEDKQTLRDLTSAIDKSLQAATQQLQDMEQELNFQELSDPDALLKTAVRVRLAQYSSLVHQLQTIVENYQEMCTSFRDKCQERVFEQAGKAGHSLSERQLEDIGKSGKLTASSMAVGSDDTKETRHQLQAGPNDLLKLEESILELRNLFMYLALIVQTQGPKLNSIELHVTKAGDYIVQSVSLLGSGLRYQRSAGKKKCCLMWCVTGSAAVLIIVLIINLT